MDETEKMTALKKAYADIILNTAKEAAARVLASERRTQALQYEQSEGKEEALRLLIRMKEMMDSTISEADKRSHSQQRKIEELEAQLQEAEDIVGNLRAELSETQYELERLMKNHHHPMRINEDVAHKEETELQENGRNDSLFLTCSPPVEEAEVLTTIEAEDLSLDEAIDMSKQLNICLGDYCFVGDPEVASIIVKSKDPELYKNGCTQRIWAFERSFLNGHPSLTEESGDLKNEKLVKEDKKGKKICMASVPSNENLSTLKENLAEVMGVRRAVANCFNGKMCRKQKRMNQSCSGKADMLRTVPIPVETLQGDASGNKSSPDVSSEKLLEASSAQETHKDRSVSRARIQSDAGDIAKASISAQATDADKDSVFDEDIELAKSLMLFSHENVCGNGEGVSSCIPGLQVENMVDSDVKISDSSNIVADQAGNHKLLKYTFHRKRKIPLMIISSDSVGDEVNTLMRKQN